MSPAESRKPHRGSLPPRDSWIQLEPGSGPLQMDARLQSEWGRKTRECRELRGEVLTKSFEIEYALDQLITEALLPKSTAAQDRRNLFDELILKGPGGKSLSGKIEMLRTLAAGLPDVERIVSKADLEKLNRIHEIRNDFAHFPITFDPMGDPANQTLQPILCSRRRLVLDQQWLSDYYNLFEKTFKALQDALTQLKQAASIDTAPQHPAGGE